MDDAKDTAVQMAEDTKDAAGNFMERTADKLRNWATKPVHEVADATEHATQAAVHVVEGSKDAAVHAADHLKGLASHMADPVRESATDMADQSRKTIVDLGQVAEVSGNQLEDHVQSGASRVAQRARSVVASLLHAARNPRRIPRWLVGALALGVWLAVGRMLRNKAPKDDQVDQVPGS